VQEQQGAVAGQQAGGATVWCLGGRTGGGEGREKHRGDGVTRGASAREGRAFRAAGAGAGARRRSSRQVVPARGAWAVAPAAA
jgi:hypothetical protein